MIVCFVDIGGIVDHHCFDCLIGELFVLLILVELLTITV